MKNLELKEKLSFHTKGQEHGGKKIIVLIKWKFTFVWNHSSRGSTLHMCDSTVVLITVRLHSAFSAETGKS